MSRMTKLQEYGVKHSGLAHQLVETARPRLPVIVCSDFLPCSYRQQCQRSYMSAKCLWTGWYGTQVVSGLPGDTRIRSMSLVA